MSFLLSNNVWKLKPCQMGHVWQMFWHTAFQLMKFLCGTLFPRVGEIGGWTIKCWRSPEWLTDAWPCASEGCQSLRHDLLLSLSVSGRSPAWALPSQGLEGREQCWTEDKSPNRAEAVSGDSEGEGQQKWSQRHSSGCSWINLEIKIVPAAPASAVIS